MTIRIITDGACRGNPGPGGWAALIIRSDHTGQTDQTDQVEEIGGYEPETTNNRMELRAAIEGLRRVPTNAEVVIVTDSRYVMRGMTEWLAGWQRRGWQTSTGTPVRNRDLWQTLADLVGQRATWQHVYGHTGDPYNERANDLAQAYAAGKRPPPAPPELAAPVAGSTARSPTGQQALGQQVAASRPARRTYLSLVHGDLARHSTWDDCRMRVHGVSGARYKKCTSPEEEIATVTAWGLPSDALLEIP
jgi:ribonuclease HI